MVLTLRSRNLVDTNAPSSWMRGGREAFELSGKFTNQLVGKMSSLLSLAFVCVIETGVRPVASTMAMASELASTGSVSSTWSGDMRPVVRGTFWSRYEIQFCAFSTVQVSPKNCLARVATLSKAAGSRTFEGVRAKPVLVGWTSRMRAAKSLKCSLSVARMV